MSFRSYQGIFVVMIGLLHVCGCGKATNDAPKLAEVSGIVTQAGKPVPGAIITFIPDKSKNTKGPSSSGQTDDKGEFTLTCGMNQKGAVIGHHKIVIACPQPVSGMDAKTMAALAKCKLPAEVGSPDLTPLFAEVPSKGKPLTIEVPAK